MTPKKRKHEQPDAQIVQGHVLDVLAGMEAESVSCVVTSPPYWSQRKYEAPDVMWPDGWRGQLGLEPTVELYVEHTVEWLRAVRRVLRPDGTCWVNLGDGYASNPAKGGSGPGGKELAYGINEAYGDARRGRDGFGGADLKEKDLILAPFRIALAAQADGWYIRSVVIWHVLNGLPESVKDRPTVTHEYILFMTKSARYFHDYAAAREAGKSSAGRNMSSVWAFLTARVREGNYASFPEELPKRCILASCPPDGLVLDPFVGVGTTGVVARRLGRRFVGIELSKKYCRMAAKRMEQTTLGIPL
jgi:DNA modification methylase